MNIDEKAKSLKIIKNPIIKAAVYSLLAMVVGIGLTWVLLGILSPVMLALLIIKW